MTASPTRRHANAPLAGGSNTGQPWSATCICNNRRAHNFIRVRIPTHWTVDWVYVYIYTHLYNSRIVLWCVSHATHWTCMPLWNPCSILAIGVCVGCLIVISGILELLIGCMWKLNPLASSTSTCCNYSNHQAAKTTTFCMHIHKVVCLVEMCYKTAYLLEAKGRVYLHYQSLALLHTCIFSQLDKCKYISIQNSTLNRLWAREKVS